MWSLRLVSLLVVSGVLASLAHPHGNIVGEWVQLYAVTRSVGIGMFTRVHHTCHVYQ